MDLKSILEKTKKKSERTVKVRKPPSIATSDRPYLFQDFHKNQGNKETNNKKLKINWRQTQDKVRTNQGQTKDKPRTKLGQSKDKVRTNSAQTQDKVRTEPRTEPRTNSGQTQDNEAGTYNFSSLVGLQRKVTLFVYEICKISRSKVTNPLSIEHIAESCETTRLSVQKTIQRLENKRIILRSHFKNGRGGWTQYELSNAIFQEIIQEEAQSKLRTNSGQTQDKVRSEPRTELRTTASSSSSDNNINNTTTIVWDLNITPLAHIGFTEKHLVQISKRTQHSPEDIQEAIYAFAHDLEKHKLKIRNGNEPLNFFMGILGKGDLYLPVSPDYINPSLKAAQLYLEKRREHKTRCQALDDELRAESFEQWSSSLSEAEKANILPEEVRTSPFKPHIHLSLLTYHRKKIWPEIRRSFYEKKDISFFELPLEMEKE